MADVCAASVAVEALSQTFRQTQKRVKRSLTSLSDAVSALQTAPGDKTAVRAELRDLIGPLEALKADVAASAATEESQLQRAVERAAFAASGPSSVTHWAWHAQLLDVSVAEFLLKNGDHDAAATLEREAHLHGFLDKEVYRAIEEVELALRSGDCSLALQWCQENGSRLRRLESPLAFQLTLQEFLELVRSKRHADALKFAQEKLSPFAAEAAYSKDYQVAMATIALKEPAESTIPEYAALFGSGRWDELARLFQREVRRAYGMSIKGMLDVTVQAGLCALKTRACRDAGSSEAMELEETRGAAKVPLAAQCPVCCPAGQRLSASLPFPHRSQTVLLCPITHERINENNLPYMLPGGRMISQRALQQLLVKGEGGPQALEMTTQDVLAARQVYII